MNQISTKVLSFIRRENLIKEGDTVYLAVSGGADSIAMALILKELSLILKCSLFIINIEHGIRGEESKKDSEFVLDFANANDIDAVEIRIDSVGFSKENGYSLEEGARILRYEKMREFILDRELKNTKELSLDPSLDTNEHHLQKKTHFSLATAHHAEDSVETTLFNMVRGSGLRGLAGIDSIVELNGISTIRPLLCLTRPEIEDFLKEKNVTFRHDSTNDDDEISRNYIRHRIIPDMMKLNEKAVSNIFLSSKKIGEAYSYFLRKANELLGQCERNGNSVSSLQVSFIREIEPELRPYLIFEWLRKNLISIKDIGSSHIDAIINLSLDQEGTKKVLHLPAKVVIVREEGRIFIKKNNENLTEKNPTPLVQISENVIEKPCIFIRKCEIENTEKPLKIAFDKGYFEFSIIPCVNFLDFPRKNYTKWFDYDNIRGVLCLRYREEGDRISTVPSADSIPLRRYFINEKIKKDERGSIPLLSDGHEIVWILGKRIGDKYKVTEHTKRILVVNFYGCEDLK